MVRMALSFFLLGLVLGSAPAFADEVDDTLEAEREEVEIEMNLEELDGTYSSRSGE